MYCIALVAILSLMNNSSWAQETIITAPGEYVVPYGEFPNNPTTTIVVEKVDPSLVKIGFGWSSNFWSTPVGHSEDNSSAGFVSASLPGSYDNLGDGGYMGTIVSYISDPWIKVDGAVVPEKEHLKDFNDSLGTLTVNGTSFPIYGTIVAENYVEIQLSNLFNDSNYGKFLFQYGDDAFIASGVLMYQITSSGTYYLQTRSGPSCPIERTGIKVVITESSGSGIVEMEKKPFISPSFVQSVFFISSESPIQRVVIYAISGNKVLEKTGDIREVEVSHLSAGIYVVQVLKNGKVLSQKIVKQ
ncbi:hypothetical protein FACS1894176_09580 [Bacteroidia bacterium]|nr:hypothetical protein FACS1894176_09580 [Bacteroidia bacterium]